MADTPHVHVSSQGTSPGGGLGREHVALSWRWAAADARIQTSLEPQVGGGAVLWGTCPEQHTPIQGFFFRLETQGGPGDTLLGVKVGVKILTKICPLFWGGTKRREKRQNMSKTPPPVEKRNLGGRGSGQGWMPEALRGGPNPPDMGGGGVGSAPPTSKLT